MEQNNVERTARSFGPRAMLVLAGGILMHIALGQSYTVGKYKYIYLVYTKHLRSTLTNAHWLIESLSTPHGGSLSLYGCKFAPYLRRAWFVELHKPK